MWFSCLPLLSLSSPLSGSIRSTSSSWPHCVVAVSLFNLSFPLPLQLALSFYPFLTPFLVYTQSVGLFVILLIPRSSPLSRIKWKSFFSLSSFFFSPPFFLGKAAFLILSSWVQGSATGFLRMKCQSAATHSGFMFPGRIHSKMLHVLTAMFQHGLQALCPVLELTQLKHRSHIFSKLLYLI